MAVYTVSTGISSRAAIRPTIRSYQSSIAIPPTRPRPAVTMVGTSRSKKSTSSRLITLRAGISVVPTPAFRCRAIVPVAIWAWIRANTQVS